jgi:anti-anti-sigma factor
MQLLRLEEGPGPASFRLIGELDISNAAQVTDRLLEELRGAGRLTLDTTELAFVDAQGLHMLSRLGRQAEESGTTVTVINCSSLLKRVLEIAVPTGIPGVHVIEADR